MSGFETSGFVSGEILSSSSNSNSYSSSSSFDLDSFASAVENDKTLIYNEFATNYICKSIPVPNSIFCEGDDEEDSKAEDSNEFQIGRIPFQNPILEDKYFYMEKFRRDFGLQITPEKSVRRRKYLIPSTTIVYNQMRDFKNCKNDDEKRVLFYQKAAQWCEVNKALCLDLNWPKKNLISIVRNQFSKEHQEALRIVKNNEILKKEKEKILLDKNSNSKPKSPKTVVDKIILEEDENYQDLRNNESIEQKIMNIIGEPLQIIENKDKKEAWQLFALKTTTRKARVNKKKSFWRKNIYPPKSLEEVLAEKRRLLPPLKPFHLQTDELSGIWDPVLMKDSFVNKSIENEEEEDQDKGPNWYKMQESKEKCSAWLKSIPNDL